MIGTPHNKAYLYQYNFVSFDGKPCIGKSVIALKPTAPAIHELIDSWNARKENAYTVLEELEVKKAIHMRGVRGGTINSDWKLLDTMQYHSIEISVQETKVLA